jgi:hypothetical protein
MEAVRDYRDQPVTGSLHATYPFLRDDCIDGLPRSDVFRPAGSRARRRLYLSAENARVHTFADRKGRPARPHDRRIAAPGQLGDPAAVPALDEEVVAAGLTAMGWRMEDREVRADDLRDDSSQLIYGADVALLEPVVFDDRLRFLNFDTINASDDEWGVLEAGLRELAESVNATFRPANAD